jgi:acyl-CoA synthetase (AMP-forming)/AMP-acid ligase II
MPVRLDDAWYAELMLRTDTPPVGRALYGCEVAVLDGEVCVRGHSLMTGYLGNPEATAEALRDGWLRTGDLGRLDPGPEGPLLTITGRRKHIAKCGGIGVSFEEIERAVRRSPLVSDACCVSRPHTGLGEAVTLFVSPVGGADAARERVAAVVDPARVGLRIVELEALPRLRSGKPDRVGLTARARA